MWRTRRIRVQSAGSRRWAASWSGSAQWLGARRVNEVPSASLRLLILRSGAVEGVVSVRRPSWWFGGHGEEVKVGVRKGGKSGQRAYR